MMASKTAVGRLVGTVTLFIAGRLGARKSTQRLPDQGRFSHGIIDRSFLPVDSISEPETSRCIWPTNSEPVRWASRNSRAKAPD